MAAILIENVPEFETGQRLSSGSRNYYRILQQLGSGGNSHVYLAEALTNDNRGLLFALKLFVRIRDDTRLQRFRNEISFLQESSHPAILRIYDHGHVPVAAGESSWSYPFVVTEYLPKTLADAMRGGLSMPEKVTFALQLISAISFLAAYKSGVVHRDIKPENIFIRGTSAVLGDFGLMKLLDTEANDAEFVLESTGPRLPRYYRTPDLVDYCRSKAPLKKNADVFQLGLVLAEMFSGKCPLVSAKHILDPVVLDPLERISGTHGVAIGDAIRSMLEFRPEMRPGAQDLMDRWQGIFLEVVKIAHQLEGRVFGIGRTF